MIVKSYEIEDFFIFIFIFYFIFFTSRR